MKRSHGLAAVKSTISKWESVEAELASNAMLMIALVRRDSYAYKRVRARYQIRIRRCQILIRRYQILISTLLDTIRRH